MKGRSRLPTRTAGRHSRSQADKLLGKAFSSQQKGDLRAAAGSCQRAIKLFPGDPRAYLLLAHLYQQQGLITNSMQAYRRCLQHIPGNIEALINLGMLCKASGDTSAAIDCYQQAIRQAPNIPEAHNNLGNALRDLGRFSEAESAYQQATTLKPDFPGAWHNLGRLQLEHSRLSEALLSLRRACSLPDSTPDMQHDLADCLGLLPMTQADDSIESDLLRCLALPRIDGRMLSRATARYLCTQIFTNKSAIEQTIAIDVTDPRLLHPLLIVLLYREPLCNRTLEVLLTHVRRQYLLSNSTDDTVPGWLSALAYQCYLNEYVWNVTAEETTALDDLEQALITVFDSGETAAESTLMIYASYRPLNRLALHPVQTQALCDKTSPELARLLRQQILEPALETELRESMNCLTDVSDQVSNAVRSQYEVNPYPRWQILDQPTVTDLAAHLQSLFPHVRKQLFAFSAKPDILIAGCGTGLQALRMARRIPEAAITAVDLSLASLAYGQRRAQELDLVDRIRFAQADILQLTPAFGRFDCVECFGVLHHMADPEAGWHSLRALLKPGGVMRIGLYSEQARTPIRAARKLIHEQSIPSSLEGIRACRKLLAELPAQHPASVLIDSPDFYSASECRDLLFHVQEQQLNIHAIATILSRLELEFLGFEFNSLAELSRYRNHFPDDLEAVRLENWDRLEQEYPDTFSAQYVFWVRAPL